MSILSKVGRKHPVVRLQIASLHLLLAAGALTILIPFIVMLTISLSSVTDFKAITLYPKYVFSTQELFKKYLAAKNNEDLLLARSHYPGEGANWVSWNQFDAPLHAWDKDAAARMRTLKADWEEFVLTLPQHFIGMTFTNVRSSGRSQYAFQDFLSGRYADIDEYNHKNGTNQPYLSQISFPSEGGALFYYPDTPLMQDYIQFKAQAPSELKRVFSTNDAYGKFLYAKYKNDIKALNLAWGSSYSDPWFTELAFPLSAPSHPARHRDRLEFIHHRFPMLAVTLSQAGAAGYPAAMRRRFRSVDEFNKVAGTAYKSWAELKPQPNAPLRGEIALWADYARTLPEQAWSLDYPELRYREFLKKKHGSLEKAWDAYGMALTSAGGESLLAPVKVVDELNFKQGKAGILWYFLTDNYVQVARFMILQGRAAVNTLILVLLSVLTSLLINPMAAYALSRFRLGYTSKILLFLLATAAFPAEVTQIPQFLMMKEMGMLNTFAALVLPGIANGFFIFLLKGFFDSLPKEIYEAAILDGASESVMFTRIAVPLASPILAVIALGAFTYAYSAYQFAIVVCPDPKMWTLMVYLQQFMNTNPYYLVMASFALASVPTLLVFLLAQRVILRGIVIPTMH